MRLMLTPIIAIAMACIPKVDTRPPEVLIEPGLKAFPTPRTADSVGTIVRIDRNGVSHRFTTLTLIPPATPSPEVLPQLSMTDTVSASLVLNFLKLLSGSPTIGATTGRTVVLHFSATGARREQSDDLTLRKALAPILSQLDFTNGNRYHLISETIIADSINYTVAQTQVDSLGGKANLESIVGGSIGIRNNGSSGYTLTARLNPAMRIFYKTEEITRDGAGMITISSLPVKSVDQIKLVKDQSHTAIIRDW
jgi:hypothetical protein